MVPTKSKHCNHGLVWFGVFLIFFCGNKRENISAACAVPEGRTELAPLPGPDPGVTDSEVPALANGAQAFALKTPVCNSVPPLVLFQTGELKFLVLFGFIS